jgi:hypothetical protein
MLHVLCVQAHFICSRLGPGYVCLVGGSEQQFNFRASLGDQKATIGRAAHRELILFSMMIVLAFFFAAAIAVQNPVPEVHPVMAITLPLNVGRELR